MQEKKKSQRKTKRRKVQEDKVGSLGRGPRQEEAQASPAFPHLLIGTAAGAYFSTETKSCGRSHCHLSEG
jgi:hypothetical protein